ncbi:MAG: hypothetical protein HFJ17_02080 [Clostridia bacterium]|nr:hypothetical protein [Clostridia bacterium]
MNGERLEEMFSDLKNLMIDGFSKVNKKLEEHDENFRVINKKLEEHDENFRIINKKFDEHEKEQKADYRDIIQVINDRFNTHEEKQRKDFAKLEQTMYDRTAILFDAHEVNLDDDEKLRSEIKSIFNILENHSNRL